MMAAFSVPAAAVDIKQDEPTFADAILDRLVHNAYRLALDGPSMRDPKMSRSDTTGPVAEMADATATKSAKAVKK